MGVILLMVLYEATNIYQFKLLSSFLLIFVIIILMILLRILYFYPSYYQHFVTIALKNLASILWLIIIPLVLYKHWLLSKLQITIIISLIVVTAYISYLYLFNHYGLLQMLVIFSLVWVADSSAYYIGKAIGKNKITVKISPGKSWQGAIGAVLVTAIYFLIIYKLHIINFVNNIYYGILFTVVIVIASIAGDLLESWCKRLVGVKDSGRILPGHGGVWDRTDGLLATLAVSFILLS